MSGISQSSGNGNITGQNSMSLEQYLAQTSESWFFTGKKEYAIKAKMVSKTTLFHNDFEVVDYTVTDDGQTVILKGVFDEMWASKLSKVISTYRKLDGSPLTEEDFASRDTWIVIVSIPEKDTYYAMRVPSDINVTVETASGYELHTNLPNTKHGNGDYLVCCAGEDAHPNLGNVWILNGVIFPEYYNMKDR